MALSFRQVRHFIAVADSGKISQAAANLSVSQSAVTTAIKTLEGELDARLFERHPNGVTLTYEGHQFLQHARDIEATVSEATRALRRSGSTVTGDIRVGLTFTVAAYFLPQILVRFVRAFPGITVHMQELPREEIEAGLVNGDLDIAVMLVSNLRNSQEIDSEILVRSRRRLWARADHHLMAKETVPLAEIAAEPYVMLTVDEAQDTAMRYWRRTPLRPKVIFETSSVEAVRSMVATGMGVTILSDMVYRPWSLEGQRIEVRPVSGEVPTMDIGLGWRRNSNISAPARAFYEYLSLTYGGSGHGFVSSQP